MNSQEFIEKHKDTLICEPSGRTYSQLKRDHIVKMRIVGDEDYNNMIKDLDDIIGNE